MSPMMIVIGLSLGLILVGLVMTWLASSMNYPIAVSVVFWVGFILVIIGLILLLAPVVVWVASQLRAILGAPA